MEVKEIKAEPIIPPSQIQITLSKEEATILATILNRVGGEPSGYRKTVDTLRVKLLKYINIDYSILDNYTNYGARNTIYLK